MYKFYNNQRLEKISQTNLMINAVLAGARQIASAMSGSTGSDSQNLNKELNSFKELVFPEFAKDKKSAADRAKSIMEKVDKLGPIKVAPVGVKSGGRGQRGHR
jgi:hypothetical protein